MSRYVIVGSGKTVTVESKPLGAGGQGEVLKCFLEGKAYAMKLYHPQTGTPEQRKALERLVEKGSPAPYFLWPLQLVEDLQTKRFGYLMALRESRFRPTEDLMARRVNSTFRALLDVAIQLSDAFLKLHSKGLCYRDISFGNVFLDPTTGDVRICDNDNVDISGSAPGGVLGTPRFMAPEVVRAEASPSDMTDRYSLAVLLFYLLLGGHPLEGAREAQIKCLDLPAMNQLYGIRPLYIFDPADDSNRPVKGIQDNPMLFKAIYPTFLMKAFERAFTEGLDSPHNRLRESEWRNLFARARDLVMACPACRVQNFYDPEAIDNGRGCWHCRQKLSAPIRLRLNDTPVVLQSGTRLYPHHLQGVRFDYTTALAEVTPHPTNPTLMGLKNLSSETWTLTKPDGAILDVPPGRNAPLVIGNKLLFGPVHGEVQGPQE